MKACILAGGEGRRLRPLTCRLPKPMVPFGDRPVMEHIIIGLRELGITEIAVTLMYMGQAVRDHFGDGSSLGVKLEYFTEETPLGTAGGVRAAGDFLGGDDFVVIAGDCVSELPLEKAFAEHARTGAEATVVLTPCDDPLEYGLVLTDENGKIVRFAEKPAPEQVFSNLVNTGIYILSPSVLGEIPAGRPFDFARDLFPKLLAAGKKVMGCELEGYWCDIGDIRAYRESSVRAAGRAKNPGAAIGANASVSRCVIGAHASVGEGSTAEDSVIYGSVGDWCDLRGAVVCSGAKIGSGCSLGENSAVGEGAELGNGVSVAANTRIYAGVKVGEGRFVSGTLTASGPDAYVFDERGRCCGSLAPESAAVLGQCAASLLPAGSRVAVGRGMLSLAGGVTAAGCGALLIDASTPAEASAAGSVAKCALTLFPFEGGLYVFGADGLPVTPGFGKKLVSALSRRDFRAGNEPGEVSFLTGCADIYASLAAAGGEGRGMPVSARDPLLRRALSAAGFTLRADAENSVALSPDGFSFFVNRLDSRTSLALALLTHFLEHPDAAAAVAYGAPLAYERLPGKVLRTERDGAEADRLYAAQLFARDGTAGAVKLLSYLARTGTGVEKLLPLLPKFALSERTVECRGEPAAIMRRLSESLRGLGCEFVRGVRVALDGGYVTLSPGLRGREIRVTAEGDTAEFASEISADFAGRTYNFDEKRR